MTLRAGGSETDCRFKVKTPGLVYAVIGPTHERSFKSDGWKTIERFFGGPGGKQDYLVLEKAFEAGDHTISGEGWFTTRLLLPPSSQGK